jgi:RNA polymerase sigma-70 factor (ECF subfamily)
MALRLDDIDLDRDRALVERFQSGDAAAFDELYRRYFSRLRRYCEKRVGDPHEAEEVAQEAFVRALRAMPGFAGDRRFYPWMTVIASRLCVDTHRRLARTTPEAEIDSGWVEGGQEQVVAAVDTDLLREALDRLGPRHREVLHLRETEGWSYQHIADHYDVSMGTVEALLFRARKALRREFTAVAGRDGGFLGSLPILGWLLRKLGGLRAHIESSNAGSLLPIAVNVSAVVAIGSAAAFVPHHSGGTSRLATNIPTAAVPAAPTGPVASAPSLTAAASNASSAAAARKRPSPPSRLPPCPRPAIPAGGSARPSSTGTRTTARSPTRRPCTPIPITWWSASTRRNLSPARSATRNTRSMTLSEATDA